MTKEGIAKQMVKAKKQSKMLKKLKKTLDTTG